jgi:electron transport complex protein RnfC
MLEINTIDQAYLAIKKGNDELRNRVNSYIGTYLKIKLVEVNDLYPMGWERKLIKDITGTSYKNYPIDKGIIVNNVSTIYSIYEALKYKRVVTEKLVTITGNMIKKPQNIIVKVGTPIKEVINSIGGYKEENQDINFIAGGPMMGITLDSDDLVVSSNLNCVLVQKNESSSRTTQCLRCGKCVEVCPAKIAPILICDNIDNLERLKELEPHRCMDCGLCTFICPAKIKLRNIVNKAKNELKEEKEKKGE